MTKPFTERDREPSTHELPDRWRARAADLDQLSPGEHQRSDLLLAEGQAQACKLLAAELEASLQRESDGCAAAQLEAAKAAREDVLREFEALAARFEGAAVETGPGTGNYNLGMTAAYAGDARDLRELCAKLRGNP